MHDHLPHDFETVVRSIARAGDVLYTNTSKQKQAESKPAEKGLKYDAGKPQMDLLDPWALEGLAEVLTFGAKKYASHNWVKGIPYSRLLAAMLRHLMSIQKGEYLDPESGLPHIDHAGCCWMFLSSQMKRGTDMDDLPFGPNGEFKNS